MDSVSVKGTGKTLDEALTAALRNATSQSTVADADIKWIMGEVTGERGTIAGLNNVTVEIRIVS
ncbi:hypothetical protein [Paraburkholderia sp. RL17-347-BIC-D]|uniref:hypothetical protein n=1 Tax=Paraburkholderia sp. RL17-347-BIC-D TaxID=3031632 RepID=UPI0038BA7440